LNGRWRTGFLLIGIIFLTINLRGAITGVGPVLGAIQADLGLSAGIAGLLTTLPVFAFATISPLAPSVATKLGIERTLFAALMLIMAGLALRVTGGSIILFLGTAIVGTGIAVGNVLVPGLIRRDFPDRLATVTAIFTMTMVIAGGVGSGIAVPLAEIGGWRFSLLAWLTPGIVAAVIWLPQLSSKTRPQHGAEGFPKIRGLLRSALAWQVTLLMGLQASGFYVLITWLPSILAEDGVSAATAGWVLFLFQLAILAGTMIIPVLINKLPDQKGIGVGCGVLLMIGYAGLLFHSDWVIAWMTIAGVGSGGSLSLCLTLFGLRAANAQQTVSLSGMAQSIGYLIAAVMPLGLGFVHDVTGTWTPALVIMIGVVAGQMIAGYLAGRPLTLSEEPS